MHSVLDSNGVHHTYKGLPALAGVCDMHSALETPGLPLLTVVSRLKRLYFAFLRVHQLLIEQIPSEPIYELKMGFSLQAHLCVEHAAALGHRVSEMREPPLGLDAIPDVCLAETLEEIRRAPDQSQRLLGLYGIVWPAICEALERLRSQSHPVADYPTIRLCRFAVLEAREIVEFGSQTLAALVDETQRVAAADWLAYVEALLSAAGGLDGSAPPTARPPSRLRGPAPAVDVSVRRDERFSDPYNMGVNAEAYLYDPQFDDRSKVVMMFYKRLREIDVPEVMASILSQTRDKPFEYVRDMTRQLWDEARHAMLGEIGFTSLGIDWSDVPINSTWSMSLNSQLTPLERHAVLFFIEQGLMPKTGKRFEWETAVASENKLAALIQDFDWADEVLHSQIGRRWYVKEMESLSAALDFGDRCWSRVFMNWDEYKSRGLTSHRNWWPEIYRKACEQMGIEPAPQSLAFDVSYRASRADLKSLPAE